MTAVRQPKGNTLLTVVFVAAILLVGLHVYGYFFPGSLNWGFHFLGFLPPQVLIVYLVLAAVAVAPRFRAGTAGFCSAAGEFMDRRPVLFLSVAASLFALMSALLGAEASLLGDSFTLILNFRDYRAGVADLAPWHEPLSMYVMYYAVTLIASLDYPGIFAAFHVVDTLLGVVFLVVAFFIVRSLFREPAYRFLGFALVASLPSMQFFFGYVEIYPVSTVFLALFVLASILVLRGRMSFMPLPVLWFLVTLSHYINGALALSLLYLTWTVYRNGRWKSIVTGYVIAGSAGLAVLAAAQFRIDRLVNQSPVSHFLSLTGDISPVNAYSQAYTMVSPFHLGDLAVCLIMMAPFASVLLAVFLWRHRLEVLRKNRENAWFAFALVPLALLWVTAKLEQGSASDWDVFGAQFILLNLFAILLLEQYGGPAGARALILIVCVTFLNSMTWFMVNSSAESSVRRFVTLWDRRNLSQLGNYTMALRLSRYYESSNDTAGRVDAWKRFSGIHPGDPRGYRNTIDAMNSAAPHDFTRKEPIYLEWMRIDTGNAELRREYADSCVVAGIAGFSDREYVVAGEYFRKAIRAMPSSAAYTNLGTVFAEQGLVDSAIAAYREAIRLDSTNATARYNLGTTYLERGDTGDGLALIRTAADLGSRQAEEFLLHRRSGK